MLTRRVCFRILLAAPIAVGARAQAPGRFAGTWKAEHQRKLYLVVKISAGTPLKISLTTAEISVDSSGKIFAIRGAVEHEEEVVEARIEDGRLSFTTRQESGYTIHYEIRIEDEENALLTLADEPAWVKPFRLKRS